jgi:O-antigen/teichoic acid export membrane protein
VSRRVHGLRSVLADTAVYGLGLLALPLALLLATPMLARVLGPDGYGRVEVLTAILSVASIVAILGMDNGVARSYFDYGYEQSKERRIVVRTGFLAVLAVSAALGFVLALVALLLAQLLLTKPSPAAVAATLLAFTLLPFTNGVIMSREIFRLERLRWRYVAAGVVQAAVGVTAAVALVAAGAGPAGYFGGLILGSCAALAFCLLYGGFMGRERLVDRRELVTMLRYGAPLVPAALATWVIFAVDRALLASMKGLFDVGYYGLASKVAAPLFILMNAFAAAWIPFILSQRPERQLELRARALTAVTAAAGIGYVVVLVVAPSLVAVLGGEAFAASVDAVPGIALGWLGWGVAFVIATEFAVARKTGVIAVGTLLAAVANVALNLVLIPPYGFVGAAWATAGSFFFLAAIYLFWERRTAPAPYRWGRLAIIGIVLAATTPFLIDADPVSAIRIAASTLAIGILVAVAATDRDAAAGAAGRAADASADA